MNLIRVCGGIGNQFFQYAIGRVMESKGTKVRYDLSWYDHPTSPRRPYCLERFHTKVVKENLAKRINRKFLVQERGRQYNAELTKRDNIIVRGYWQNPLYHENLLSVFRDEFTIKEEFYTEDFLRLRNQITSKPSIGIHVRRQDFAKAKVVMLPMEYYRTALKNIPKNNMYIFSDDIPWCRVNFRDFKNVTFIYLKDYLSFELMKLCKYKIIANSTFSWWAAYLGIPKQVVYRPNNWETVINGVKQKEYDMEYLQEWIKV